MKMALLIPVLALFSTQAFAGSIECVKNPDVDSRKSITFSKDGGLVIAFWESATEISAKKVSNIESADKQAGVSETQIILANDVTANWSGEGEEAKVKVTAVVVYNPTQKAARVTLLQDGTTMLRNELFTNCK